MAIVIGNVWNSSPPTDVFAAGAPVGSLVGSAAPSPRSASSSQGSTASRSPETSRRPTDTATRVRNVAGSQTLHDGPYAETREQLAGYYMVDVPDLDAAIGWAKKIPGGPNYSIEVRPVHVM